MNNPAAGTALHRRDLIARLLREGNVRSQDELCARLRERGVTVAQPTLSRDLRELGVVKTPGGYALVGPAPLLAPLEDPVDRLDRALRTFVSSVETAGTLVVLKTPAAAAHPVARALDEAALPLAAGTVAGDDTIFVAARSVADARRLADRLLAPLTGEVRARRTAGARVSGRARPLRT